MSSQPRYQHGDINHGKASKTVVISNPVLAKIANKIRGRVVLPTDADYDFLLQDGTFNKSQISRPSALLQPRGTNDVSIIMTILNDTNTEFTVAGGRHTLRCYKDNVACIDMRLMRSVMVDPTHKVVHVQGGCKLHDLNSEMTLQGVCTTVGTDPRTGMGFLLGGGWGWLARQFGMAVDNLVELELVLYDGTVVVANENKWNDIFWAVRGAGMSFGVATRFTLKTHPLPAVTIAGFRRYPIERATECLRAVGAHCRTAPKYACTMGEMNWTEPDPKTGEQRPYVHIVPVYNGPSADEGYAALQDVMDAAPDPEAEMVGEIPYMKLQTMLTTQIAPAHRTEQAVWVENLSDELVDILVDQFKKSPAPGTFVGIFAIGAVIADKKPTAMAFPWRLKSGHWITILSSGSDPAHAAVLSSWVADTGALILKHAVGQFANRIGNTSRAGENDDNAVNFFGVNAERLKKLKAVYDPKGRFANSDAGALATKLAERIFVDEAKL